MVCYDMTSSIRGYLWRRLMLHGLSLKRTGEIQRGWWWWDAKSLTSVQCTNVPASWKVRGAVRDGVKKHLILYSYIVNLKQKIKSFSQYEQYCFKLWELTRWKYRKNQQGVATRRQKRASSMSACTRLLPLQNTAIQRRGLLSLLRNGTYKLHKYIFITINCISPWSGQT